MSSMNRRDWLRTSALVTGSLPFMAGAWNGLAAMTATTIKRNVPRRLTDAEFQAQAPGELKARLFANENPFGPSDKAKKAIMDSIANSYQYPFMRLGELEEKIAAFEGIQRENLLLSAGSSPLLMAAAICFCKDGGNVVTGDPTYEDLPQCAERLGAKWIKVPL
ncbi:MAG TPA: aminotransferase class I/II-fold pyridoxal phosphate-dependent enzyme, partial [Chitinophaga sp.]